MRPAVWLNSRRAVTAVSSNSEADETVPTLEASLAAPRASTGDAAIVVGQAPGEFLYSGGGYLLLELLVEEVGGESFAEQVQQTLLDPLGMDRSGYGFIGDLDNAAPSYRTDGSRAPHYRYASMAATGLHSTIGDLARLARAMADLDGPLLDGPLPDGPLPASLVEALRQPEASMAGAAIWGAGAMLYAPTASGDFVFGHDGANDPALNVTLRVNPDTGAAIVMLVSGHPSLASTMGSEWTLWQTGVPDFLMTPRTFWSAFVPTTAGAFLLVLAAVAFTRRRKGQS